jgi:hypothetical protein
VNKTGKATETIDVDADKRERQKSHTSDTLGGWRRHGRKVACMRAGRAVGLKSGVHAERCKIREEAEEPHPAAVRASVVAKKRVTTVEPRDAGR